MYLASPFPPKMMIKKKRATCKYDDVIIVGVAKSPMYTRENDIFVLLVLYCVCWGEPELKECDCSLLSPVVFISRMEGSHQGLKSSGINCPVQQRDFEEFRGDRLTLSVRQEG